VGSRFLANNLDPLITPLREWPLPGGRANRPKASMKIEKQRASKNTPLTNAAIISALCHPYEYLELAERFDNYQI
jgi:hypothetical protein